MEIFIPFYSHQNVLIEVGCLLTSNLQLPFHLDVLIKNGGVMLRKEAVL
jgi:hypothetical protein